YQWTPAGRRALRELVRDGKVIESTAFRYDLLGRRTAVSIDGEVALTFEYDETTMRLNSKRFGDGSVVEYGWDEAGRPASLRRRDSEGNVLNDHSLRMGGQRQARPAAQG